MYWVLFLFLFCFLPGSTYSSHELIFSPDNWRVSVQQTQFLTGSLEVTFWDVPLFCLASVKIRSGCAISFSFVREYMSVLFRFLEQFICIDYIFLTKSSHSKLQISAKHWQAEDTQPFNFWPFSYSKCPAPLLFCPVS